VDAISECQCRRPASQPGYNANAASRPIMRLTVLTSLASKLGRHDLGPWHF